MVIMESIPSFVKSSVFVGARPGYVYKLDDLGLGYYLEDSGLVSKRIHSPKTIDDEPIFSSVTGDQVSTEDVASELFLNDRANTSKSSNPYDDLPVPRKKMKTGSSSQVEQEKKSTLQSTSSKNTLEISRYEINSIRCLHIVLKHAFSRNPTSWRNPHERITRSLDDAVKQLSTIRARIIAAPSFTRPYTFEDAAKTYSDCKSAAKGGDLGVFCRGKMNKTFEDAAFKLEINEVSDIVRTSNGVHIILRIA
mmetsp:Transcript_16016/g.24031  ORF Transcript_16016/g.24031 Transcript_16016/m.24031 type:complete len:251 (-) Transcript_16016:91-843(-)